MLYAARRLTTVAVLALIVVLSIAVQPSGAAASTAYYLAVNGNDANPGTEAAPFATFTFALKQLRAGDTLYVRGGTYVGDVILNGSATLAKGTAANRITVTA
jgi:hypothetical protein